MGEEKVGKASNPFDLKHHSIFSQRIRAAYNSLMVDLLSVKVTVNNSEGS